MGIYLLTFPEETREQVMQAAKSISPKTLKGIQSPKCGQTSSNPALSSGSDTPHAPSHTSKSSQENLADLYAERVSLRTCSDYEARTTREKTEILYTHAFSSL